MHSRALLFLLVVCACGATCAAASDTATTFISGRTVDGDTGAPLPGVDLFARSTAPGHKDAGHSVTSDSSGKFRLAVPPGELEMHWDLPWNMPHSLLYDRDVEPIPRFSVPKSGLSGVVVRIPKRQMVMGRVQDASGKPVAAASVTVGPPGYNLGALTDDKGLFILVLPSRAKSPPG